MIKTTYKSLLAGIPLLWLTATAGAAGTQKINQSASGLYKEECAACHMAYPAHLLPARSWNSILNNLDKHFGDNASLEPASLKILRRYLQDNSADAGTTRRSRRFLRSIKADEVPLRISELPYVRRQHHELPARFVSANPKVRTLGNCIACHQGAERGLFNEDTVRIPGYGRWED